ncbi:MAG: hypothetical protein SPI86_01805 [Treponemataceae bacterium]|nr:hypothetical protein [Spirochaetales bacterium]MDY6030474.1 hypothetical protein [Treponemataceae bacterium]
MKKGLSVLVILAALVALVGCGFAASTLVGTTWEERAGNFTITWVFGPDRVLTKTTKVETSIGSTTSTPVTCEYSVSGDKLFITEDDTTTEYTVVKTVSTDKTYYLEIKNSEGETLKTLYPAVN